ncbi:MAG: Flp family type IVb pilin [Chloroflexi bacterium]|nr:Flp family type IVb pilin [Chloroflexota bacterium]
MVEHFLRILSPVNEERGQALAEYSLLLAFVAMACVIALGALGLAVAGQIDVVTAAFS